MKQFRKSAAAAMAGLGTLVLLTAPGFAAGDHGAAKTGTPVQPAHMTQGYGPGSGYGTGPGMMGQGYGMGYGMMGLGFGGQGALGKDLSTDDVRHVLEHRLEWHGNERLKLGEVKEADDDTIVADIVTQDGSLVQRLKIDRHTGRMQQAE